MSSTFWYAVRLCLFSTPERFLQTCETHHPAIENLPDTRGYATNDLFIPHPTKKGLWKMSGLSSSPYNFAAHRDALALDVKTMS